MTESGAMKIEFIKSDTLGDYYAPKTHVELFRHCAGGLTTADPHDYENRVKPLLMAHGVGEIKIL